MIRSEIMATLKEVNNLSLLPGANVKIVKCGSTAKFNLVVKIDNKVYYTDIWLSNYDLFDDVSKELKLYFKQCKIIPSKKISRLINKVEKNPFYMDWDKINGIYQLEIMATNYINNIIIIQDMDDNNEDVKTILNWATSPNRICTINKIVDGMFCSSKTIKFLENTNLPYDIEGAINRIVADKMLSATEERLMEFFGEDTPDMMYNILLYINTNEQKLNHIIDLVESAISKRDKEVADYFSNLVDKWESDPNNPYNDPEYHWRNTNGYDAAIENIRKMASQYVGSPYVEDDNIPLSVLSDINLLIQEW